MSYEFDLLYYINLFKKWWKTILIVVGIAAFLTAFFSYMQPRIYETSVTILTPSGNNKSLGPLGLGALLGFSQGVSVQGSGGVEISSIVKSRRMNSDIIKRFELDKKPDFKWSISIGEINECQAIIVEGTDPILIQKIANFTVENLDKINDELDITANRPIAKILDPAIPGVPKSRQIPRKMLVAGILAFLVMSLYAFFSDYIKKLKGQ